MPTGTGLVVQCRPPSAERGAFLQRTCDFKWAGWTVHRPAGGRLVLGIYVDWRDPSGWTTSDWDLVLQWTKLDVVWLVAANPDTQRITPLRELAGGPTNYT